MNIIRRRALFAQAELERTHPTTWFYFDGKAHSLRALEKVPMEDVALQAWAKSVAALGAAGLDTRLAAQRWFSVPDASFTDPTSHAFTANNLTVAMILYGSMSENVATRMHGRPSPAWTHHSSRHRASQWSSRCCPAAQVPTREQFLKAFQAIVNDNFKPFSLLTEEVPDGELDAVAVLKSADIPLLRQARRKLIATNNPHRTSSAPINRTSTFRVSPKTTSTVDALSTNRLRNSGSGHNELSTSSQANT